MYRYLFLLAIILLGSCIPPSEKGDLDIVLDYEDPSHIAILNAKDQRNADQIGQFLQSEDVTERFLAVEASASLQDQQLADQLFQLLNSDPSQKVRATAAYAIGQIGQEENLSRLVESFAQQDTTNYNSPVRSAILEAVGKCGDQGALNLIASVRTYGPDDDQLLLGQARAIYRFGLRNIHSDQAVETMVERLLDNELNDQVRLMSAHYLARNPNLDIDEYISRLTLQLVNETNDRIRMVLAGGLVNRGNINHISSYLSLLSNDPDYRLRCNILRNLSSYNYDVYRDAVIPLLDSDNKHLFNLTCSLLRDNARRQDAGFFIEKSRQFTDPGKRAKVLGIALNSLPANFINTRRNVTNEIRTVLATASAPTDIVSCIQALSLDPLSIQDLIESGLKSSDLLVRTKSIIGVRDLLTNPRTQQVYARPALMSNFRAIIGSEFNRILAEGDPGSVAAIAGILRDESCGFKEIPGINLALRSAMRMLDLPRDYEAKKECLLTLNYLEDTIYQIDPPVYNQNIDWSVLEDINDSSRTFIITTAGQIEIQLFKSHAQGSVANFVKLSQDNYYDGKTIHRVVPNFVIQGGCPRGDGFGSLDYTIRSELGPKYYDDEGYLGMASAGKDTEGTQWFITHSPTPHLDGRYTIFGKVISGMEVVHRIQEGDIIQDVRILKF